MSTRGLYGLRKNGVDKTCYNHCDSYPRCLGKSIVEFCATTSIEDMSKLYDQILLVNEGALPTQEQVLLCLNAGLYDGSVGEQGTHDWYCLLRKLQGDLLLTKEVADGHGVVYMIDDHLFIEDSLFCEYAYIINLDTNNLEFWLGWQHDPQPGNRYGEQADDGYYPCKLVLEIPLDSLDSTAAVNAAVDMMIKKEKDEEEAASIDYDPTF